MGVQLAEQRIAQILATEPERDFAAQLCLEAWNDLSTCRPVHSLGMAGAVAGSIPWTVMAAWCEFHGLDYESAAVLIRVLRQIDLDRAERDANKRALEEQAARRRGGVRR